MAETPEVIGEGKHLRLVRKGHWEYTERTRPARAVFIAAVTDDGKILMTHENRVPVGGIVVGFPAGLVGDTAGEEDETLETATRRELIEEAGYDPGEVEFLTRGPSCSGMVDEVIAVMLATRLKRVGEGGGVGQESIRVEEVPLGEVHAWLGARVAEGALIDPKVYTGLYFIERRADPR